MEKVVQIFSNFAEAEAGDSEEDLRLTPEQNMDILLELQEGSILAHLSNDLREFAELLNSQGADYVVVGAFAVAGHGHSCITADGDVRLQSAMIFLSI